MTNGKGKAAPDTDGSDVESIFSNLELALASTATLIAMRESLITGGWDPTAAEHLIITMSMPR